MFIRKKASFRHKTSHLFLSVVPLDAYMYECIRIYPFNAQAYLTRKFDAVNKLPQFCAHFLR